ncbi:hypothetical protein [Sediminibacterium sp.]|jgi:hypothetical protein|uniref:hypothetical protein n=1 Tax=Sediminibacterium sp. TaxID=1917865 RepID=UPI0025DEBDAE|nr:hypothetical protein [Sediminibacterium sp.]MBW0178799.1 hypothetical protein [Sediminibacterium sp.]
MMDQLFSVLLMLHIAGGGTGLIAGTIAASVKKGSKPHLLSGIVFFWGMLTASLSALVLSRIPGHENLFLFAVGGFTLYMILTGYRIVILKRKFKTIPVKIPLTDYLITVFGLLFAIFLLIQSVKGLLNGYMFSIVPGVFGGICLSYVLLDAKLFMGRTTIKTSWMYSHIVRMMGAMIASYTAFLVVNVQIEMQWILWLLPSVIGSIFITQFIRKYVVSTQK